jgi:hypothetical protein
MLTVVWSTLFLLFAVVGSTFGAITMIGMPVAPEIEAIVVILGAATAATGLAALVFKPPPTFRDSDPIPPYFIGTTTDPHRRAIGG